MAQITLKALINDIGELNGLDDVKTTELYYAVDQFIDDWFRKYEANQDD